MEAARAAQSGHVPAPRHDLRFRARKHAAPVERSAFRVPARLAVIAEHLEAPEHPARLLTATAELPPAADPITAGDRHRLPAARHCGSGDDRVRPLPVNFVDALI